MKLKKIIDEKFDIINKKLDCLRIIIEKKMMLELEDEKLLFELLLLELNELKLEDELLEELELLLLEKKVGEKIIRKLHKKIMEQYNSMIKILIERRKEK